MFTQKKFFISLYGIVIISILIFNGFFILSSGSKATNKDLTLLDIVKEEGNILSEAYLHRIKLMKSNSSSISSKNIIVENKLKQNYPFEEAISPVILELKSHSPVSPALYTAQEEKIFGGMGKDIIGQKKAIKISKEIYAKVQIAVIIDDLGLSKKKAAQFIKMKEPITLSFLPYASGINKLAQEGRDHGHEIMLHIPMQPKSDLDSGPHTLSSYLSVEEQYARIHLNFSKLDNFVGFNNHMGSQFTENRQAVSRILEIAKEKGYLVVDSKTSPRSVLQDEAERLNIPNISRDIFLDNVPTEEAVWQELKRLEKIAKKRGHAVAIGHPYKVTILVLKKWLSTLKDKGIEIVPVSYLAMKAYHKKQLAIKGSVHVASILSPVRFDNQQGSSNQAALSAY